MEYAEAVKTAKDYIRKTSGFTVVETENFCKALERLFNSFSSPQKILDLLDVKQNISVLTDIATEWVFRASLDNYRFDKRNEASHEKCFELSRYVNFWRSENALDMVIVGTGESCFSVLREKDRRLAGYIKDGEISDIFYSQIVCEYMCGVHRTIQQSFTSFILKYLYTTNEAIREEMDEHEICYYCPMI